MNTFKLVISLLILIGVATSIPVLPEEVLDYHFIELKDLFNEAASVIPSELNSAGKPTVCDNSAANDYVHNNAKKMFEYCDREFVACFKSESELQRYIATTFPNKNLLTLASDSKLVGKVVTIETNFLSGNVTNLMPCHKFLDYVICHDLHSLKASNGVTEFHNPSMSTMMIVESGQHSNSVAQAVFMKVAHASKAHVLKPGVDRAFMTLDGSANVISTMHQHGHSAADMALDVLQLWNKNC